MSDAEFTEVAVDRQSLLNSSGDEVLTLADAFVVGSKLEQLKNLGNHKHSLSESDQDKVLSELTELRSLLEPKEFNSAVEQRIEKWFAQSPADDSPLNKESSDDIKQWAATSEHLLREELKNQKRVPVSDTGLINSERLVDSPESLFEPEVWRWLSERAKNDLQEACRTLAVDCSVSSVMLSLRAVEDCLREWHESENGTSLEALGVVS